MKKKDEEEEEKKKRAKWLQVYYKIIEYLAGYICAFVLAHLIVGHHFFFFFFFYPLSSVLSYVKHLLNSYHYHYWRQQFIVLYHFCFIQMFFSPALSKLFFYSNKSLSTQLYSWPLIKQRMSHIFVIFRPCEPLYWIENYAHVLLISNLIFRTNKEHHRVMNFSFLLYIQVLFLFVIRLLNLLWQHQWYSNKNNKW